MFDLHIIKKLRKAQGITQSQLAEKIGVDRSYISRLETDNILRDRSPTLHTVEKIALALNVCCKDILFYRCDSCPIRDKCKKKDINNIDDIIEEKLNFYT